MPVISLQSITTQRTSSSSSLGIITNNSDKKESDNYSKEIIICKDYSDFDSISKNVNEDQPCLLLKAVIVALNIIDFANKQKS